MPLPTMPLPTTPLPTHPASRRPRPAAPAPALRASLVAALAALGACADPGTAPRAADAPALAKSPSPIGSCTASPVQSVRVTQGTLALTVGQSATVTACTQFFGVLAVRSDDPAVATVAPSGAVTPTQPAPEAPYAATLTITAVGVGTAHVTVADRKGNAASVTVTVTAPPPAGITFIPGSTVTVTSPSSSAVAAVGIQEAGYTGDFRFVGCSATAPDSCTTSDIGASCTRTTGGSGTGADLSVSIVHLDLQNGYPSVPPSSVIQVSAPPGYGTFSPPRCTVTVGDENGNTALLTINPAP